MTSGNKFGVAMAPEGFCITYSFFTIKNVFNKLEIALSHQNVLYFILLREGVICLTGTAETRGHKKASKIQIIISFSMSG